jgi:hypothetical protein
MLRGASLGVVRRPLRTSRLLVVQAELHLNGAKATTVVLVKFTSKVITRMN